MDFYLNFCCLTPEGLLSIYTTPSPVQDLLIQNSEADGSVLSGSDTLVYQDCNNNISEPMQEKNSSDTCNEFNNGVQNLQEEMGEKSNIDHHEMHENSETEIEPEIADCIENYIPEKDIITTMKLPNGRRSTLRKRPRKSSLQQSNILHPMDAHSCPLPRRPVRSGKIRRLIPCQCHSTRKRKRYNPKIYLNDKVLKNAELIPVDEFICSSLHKFKNTAHLKVPPEIIEEANDERKKREKILKASKASLEENRVIEDHDSSVLREELNKALNENIQDDYDQLILDDDPQAEMSFCDAENLALDPAIPPDHIQLQENETDLVFEPITQEEWDLIGDHLYEPCTRSEAILQRKMAHLMLGAQKLLASNELLQRVNRWKSIIMPRLQMDEKRKHFDIHSYGNEIINKFSEIGTTLTFEEIASDFPQKDVPRVFLSCLMLGNSYNMKLLSSGGDLSMDDLEMTLLSKVQQHQQMEEYAAPSQQQTAAINASIMASTAVDHDINKRKQVTSDSGIFSTMEESTARSRLSTWEETTDHISQPQPTTSQNTMASTAVDHVINKRKQLTSDSGIFSAMEESSARSRLSTLEETTDHISQPQPTTSGHSSDSMVMYNRTYKKRQQHTCDSGIFSAIDENTATSRLSTLEEQEKSIQGFKKPASPKRKRTQSILNHRKGNKKKKVTFDPATFLSTLGGGSSFNFSNI